MSHRQLFIGAAGLILAFIGVAALWFPVYLDQFDGYGMQINCGNGLGTHSGLIHADSDTAPCGSVMLIRRLWAIPALAVGGLLVTWFVLAWARDEQKVQAANEIGQPG